LLVEEREEQGADVGAVHVGVGHDDDLVIARVVERVVLADTGPDRRDDGADLLVRKDLVDPCLLNVEDLAPQREDRLEAAVATLLGGSAGGVALDEIQLRELRIRDRAVGELPRQEPALEAALLADQLARLAPPRAPAPRSPPW